MLRYFDRLYLSNKTGNIREHMIAYIYTISFRLCTRLL